MSNGPEFFQTLMGRTYYEATMPQLVKQLTRLNENLEKMTAEQARYTVSSGFRNPTPAPPKLTPNNVRRMWEISTAHVDHRAGAALDGLLEAGDGVAGFEIYRLGSEDACGYVSVDGHGEFGWFISVPQDEDITTTALYSTTVGLEALLLVLQRAQREGFDYLLMDRDADTTHTLPTYEW